MANAAPKARSTSGVILAISSATCSPGQIPFCVHININIAALVKISILSDLRTPGRRLRYEDVRPSPLRFLVLRELRREDGGSEEKEDDSTDYNVRRVSERLAPATAPSESSSIIERIFDAALKSYKKKTKSDLKNHDRKNSSKHAIRPLPFSPYFKPPSLIPLGLPPMTGEGVALVFSPAKVVFAGVGVLLLATKDVTASQDILVDIFGRIENFFVRLEIYTEVPLTPAMTKKMVQITVEVLDILATATKEMGQSPAKRFLKKVAGWTDLEDGLEKLEKLTHEDVIMASMQVLKVVKSEVQLDNNNIKAIDD
ncbi:hypothetical protein EDB86DRAFT_3070690 [Lactarius hatsudake]|nr:hypothetical protein EDB86DRAFT_3070690 [Lactarius hatsudake]